MFGVAGLYKDTEVVHCEIVIAVEEERSVSLTLKHLHPDLKGWEEKRETVTSRFIRASGNTIWFDGLTFRRRVYASLQGFIAIRHKDGPVKEDSFTYQQVKAG
jgi:ribosomal protein S1